MEARERSVVQTRPETGPESRGGEHPDWGKAAAGEPLPEKNAEISAPPDRDDDDEKAGQ